MLNELGRTIKEVKIVLDHVPQVPQSQNAPSPLEAPEPPGPRVYHPIRVKLQREVLDLNTPNSSEVDRSVAHIFLDFSKMLLKDVHALQKATVA